MEFESWVKWNGRAVGELFEESEMGKWILGRRCGNGTDTRVFRRDVSVFDVN